MTNILNSELLKINDWMTANRLTINVHKTELMIFSNRLTNTLDNQVSLNGDHISFVDQVRFLGVKIDNRLNFGDHICYILGKISKHAGILFKIKNNLPISARLSYYNAFCLPYFSYNIIHWGGTNSSHNSLLKDHQGIEVRTIRSSPMNYVI